MAIDRLEEKLFSEMSTQEQREYLQNMNPDMLPAVFSKVWENSKWIKLKCIENILCCYPNQLQDGQIKLPDDFVDWKIVIVNLGALRKWNIEAIAWNHKNISEIENPVLLSPGVIEYWQEEESSKKYTQTVLRDWWQINQSAWITSLADANERTTTAGRNFSWNLHEDLEIENAEESPFLMQNKDWDYFLVTHDIKYKKALVESIEWYLKNKYIQPNQEWYSEVKKAFERKFKWVKYEELGDILKDIIRSNSFAVYDWEDWEILELDNTNLELDGQMWTFYVYNDKANNTIEYRAIRRITWFPEWLKPVWKIPLRLFLESQNQDPQFRRIENIWVGWTKLVPTMKDISNKVTTTINP